LERAKSLKTAKNVKTRYRWQAAADDEMRVLWRMWSRPRRCAPRHISQYWKFQCIWNFRNHYWSHCPYFQSYPPKGKLCLFGC